MGELDDNQRLFVRIAESVELGRISRKYGWCGNGRKPSSRLAMFKMFVMKHVWNFPTTKDALAEVRRCPSMRRLCGWESQSDIPSESTISRTFGTAPYHEELSEKTFQLAYRYFKKALTSDAAVRRRSTSARSPPVARSCSSNCSSRRGTSRRAR